MAAHNLYWRLILMKQCLTALLEYTNLATRVTKVPHVKVNYNYSNIISGTASTAGIEYSLNIMSTYIPVVVGCGVVATLVVVVEVVVLVVAAGPSPKWAKHNNTTVNKLYWKSENKIEQVSQQNLLKRLGVVGYDFIHM